MLDVSRNKFRVVRLFCERGCLFEVIIRKGEVSG